MYVLTLMLLTYILLGRFERRLYYQTSWYLDPNSRSDRALRVLGAVAFPFGLLLYSLGVAFGPHAHPDQRKPLNSKAVC